MVKNTPANAGNKRHGFDPWRSGRFPGGQEDPLEEGMETRSGILAWRIPWTEEDWWATIHRIAQSRTRLKQLSTARS